MEDFAMIYGLLVANGPIFAVALVGIVVALVFWSKAPLPAKLVLIACVLEMLMICLRAWMSGWFVPHLARTDHTMKSIGFIVSAITLGSSLVRATLFGLLVWAAFAGRHPAVPTPR